MRSDEIIFFRAVELARGFTGEAPRSLAILAVANSVLNKKTQPAAPRRQAAIAP